MSSIERLTPASREEWLEFKRGTIGASEVPILLGVSPFATPFELFMQKTGRIEKEQPAIRIEENSIHLPPTARGNEQEVVALSLMQQLRPAWLLELNQIPGGAVFYDRDARMSSTPDVFATDRDRAGGGAIQVKNPASMAFNRDWRNADREIEIPTYVGVQAVVDAALSGCTWSAAAALVNDFESSLYLVDVPLHLRLMDKIREKVAEFWQCVERDEPPPPDFAKDGAIIAELYKDSDGDEIDLSGNERIVEIMCARDELKAAEKAGSDAEKQRKVYDAEILHLLGNAERGRLADGRLIVAKTIKRAGYSVAPSQYRSIRVKEPK